MDIPWDELLLWIDEKGVIPIIGQDLLVVDTGNGPMPFYEVLAKKLAEDLKIPPNKLPARFDFNDILTAHPPFQQGKQKIHAKLKLTYDKLAALAIPEPLRKLARIKPLKLFVTTTFDTFLERALNEVRYDSATRTVVVAYSPKDNNRDLTTEMLDSNRSIVFHLLGQITSDANYVATDCDFVEFTHSLHAKGPARLFQALGQSNLLLVGNSFPLWLWRFFLRTAKNQVFWMRRQKMEVLIDANIREDERLKNFIECFSEETAICEELGPVAFVDELYRQWNERFASYEGTASGNGGEDPLGMEPGSIFVSYSSVDRPAVETLCDALEEAKIDAWFDRQQLKAGDDWEKKIRKNIIKCSLFMPVISQSVVGRATGRENFRDEWGWAIERLGKYTGLDLPFIVPVVIDDTRLEEAEGIPEAFTRKQVTKLPDGKAPRAFVDEIRKMVRDIQRRENKGS
jgi:TIR domain/SIR2-like domain